MHLELSLAENRQLKDQYFEKSEISQQKYQELFDQLNSIQKEIVAVDELKRDRDERIGELREELDKISQLHDALLKNYSQLKVQHETVSTENESLRSDVKSMTDNMTLTNQIRQQKEEAL